MSILAHLDPSNVAARVLTRRSPQMRLGTAATTPNAILRASIRKNKQTHEVLPAFREMRAIATAGHDVVRQILAIDVAFLHVSEFRLRDLLIARLDFDRQTGLRE